MVTLIAGYGDSAWDPYTGADSHRYIDLTGSSVMDGDLIVVFATVPTTGLGSGGGFGSLQVDQVGGSLISNGPNNAPGDLGFSRGNNYPLMPLGQADEWWGHIGSCIWDSAGGSVLRAGFSTPPTGLVGEPGFCNVVIFRDANSGGVLPISAPQDPTGFAFGNTIPYEAAGDFGQPTGLWVNFLIYVGVRDLTNPGSPDTSADWVDVVVTNPGTLGYSEAPATADSALIDASPGTVIDTAQLLYTMIDVGTSLASPVGAWEVNPDQSDGITTDQRCFFGGSLSVQVWYDPDYEPPVDPDPTEANTQVVPLHIPHKDYAFGQSQITLNPLAQHKFLTNLKYIESWADGLRCSGSVTTPGTGEGDPGTITTYSPTNGKWKERQLHIPHKESFTSRHVRENYLAIERWANAICPPLHIPHKDWVLAGTPDQEQVNLLAIERWARDIGRCCGSVTVENPEDPGEA